MSTKNNPVFTIGERKVGARHPVFIIAELSGNHHHDISVARKLIDEAARAGADAVKLQTYTPNTLTLNSEKEYFRVKAKDNPDQWKGKTLYQLYEEAFTPWEWHKELQKATLERGMEFFSAPFDSTAVDFLEALNVPCYKIAAYEAEDIALLKKVASTKKPVIMSVGFSATEDIVYSVKTLRENGTKEIVLLHCLTSYSDKSGEADANLRTIPDIKERFGVLAGLSDNNRGIDIPILASAIGSSVIEKHLTLSSKDGPDAQFSLTPSEFKEMVEQIRKNEKILGKVQYGPQNEAERANKNYRRSLFTSKDIKKGEKFTENNIRSVRPGHGLAPKYYEEVLGKHATRDIEFAEPLSWDMIEKK